MDRRENEEYQNRDSGGSQEVQDRNQNKGQKQSRSDQQSHSQNRDMNQHSNDGRGENRPQGSNALADENDYRQNSGSNTQHQNQGNTKDLEKNWEEMKLTYRQKYPEVTEDDIKYKSGEFNDMTHRLAKRTNRSHEEVQKEIRGWND